MTDVAPQPGTRRKAAAKAPPQTPGELEISFGEKAEVNVWSQV